MLGFSPLASAPLGGDGVAGHLGHQHGVAGVIALTA